mmetsp:Transcript_23512/g.59471  ORF Transcript_23512/g.59471 Transcript_23512/m.59471 type:complete len:289 (-) Transcript_23512:817-1683(-)
MSGSSPSGSTSRYRLSRYFPSSTFAGSKSASSAASSFAAMSPRTLLSRGFSLRGMRDAPRASCLALAASARAERRASEALASPPDSFAPHAAVQPAALAMALAAAATSAGRSRAPVLALASSTAKSLPSMASATRRGPPLDSPAFRGAWLAGALMTAVRERCRSARNDSPSLARSEAARHEEKASPHAGKARWERGRRSCRAEQQQKSAARSWAFLPPPPDDSALRRPAATSSPLASSPPPEGTSMLEGGFSCALRVAACFSRSTEMPCWNLRRTRGSSGGMRLPDMQ